MAIWIADSHFVALVRDFMAWEDVRAATSGEGEHLMYEAAKNRLIQLMEHRGLSVAQIPALLITRTVSPEGVQDVTVLERRVGDLDD